MVTTHTRYQLLLMIVLGSSLLVGCDEAPETTTASSETSASDTVSESAATSTSDMAADTTLDTNQASKNKVDDGNADTSGGDNSSTDAPVIAATTEQAPLAANAGATLYESKCKVCHTAGLLNAPKYGDTAAWATRLDKGKETLYLHSAKGFNKMPAQAVDGVTEAQVNAAVDYMLASVS